MSQYDISIDTISYQNEQQQRPKELEPSHKRGINIFESSSFSMSPNMLQFTFQK